LSQGGGFDIDIAGVLAFSEANSTEITGLASFTSNVVHATVDGKEAGEVHRAYNQNRKRTAVQDDCTGAERTATTNAIANCRSLAVNAASAASSGSSSKMNEYFKSATTTTRRTVSDVFNRIASECGSTTSGVSRQYCTDVYSACQRGVIAYTAPSQNLMVNCPYYFTFPARSRTCHAIDQGTTTLHEVTHLRPIKGTDDYCYGYDCVQSLSTAQNLNNADTYTLFAQCK
jgi:deuterolysin